VPVPVPDQRRTFGDMETQSVASAAVRGRPLGTSHSEIERAAFELFAERGFEGTTMTAIAERVGVSRRTLFRYYPSKNDIPWGQFEDTLGAFRALLDAQPTDLPLREAVNRSVVAFNDFPADADPAHRDRMRLILETPTSRRTQSSSTASGAR
jgi:AcrR family transcriptional regulator